MLDISKMTHSTNHSSHLVTSLYIVALSLHFSAQVQGLGTTLTSFSSAQVQGLGTTLTSFSSAQVQGLGTTLTSFGAQVQGLGTTSTPFSRAQVQGLGTTLTPFSAYQLTLLSLAGAKDWKLNRKHPAAVSTMRSLCRR
ncbi:hypothetical protein EMCRGX_G032346 [Ephydatia muelleri]